LDARGGFHVVGEQIDGSFQHGNDTYLLEAKWHARRRTPPRFIDSRQGERAPRMGARPVRELFRLYRGRSARFTAKKIILADGMDIYDALARRLSIPDIIAAKVRHASEYRNPFERVRSLFPL